MKIENYNIKLGNKVFVIAEIGMNYNANFFLIYELIKQAKLSGATICIILKVQYYRLIN